MGDVPTRRPGRAVILRESAEAERPLLEKAQLQGEYVIDKSPDNAQGRVETVLRQIEDKLFPQLALDVYERVMYYFVFRHTTAAGKSEVTMGLPDIAAATSMSEWKARETIRSLDAKGCLRISRSKDGHRVEVVLPKSIPGVMLSSPAEERLDIEQIDFYRARRYVVALLEREQNSCFYCAKPVTVDACALDHVRPLARGGDNTFRNVVAACHECNSLKQDMDGAHFVRTLYRRGVLSQSDVEARIASIEALCAGHLRPHMAHETGASGPR